MGSNTVRWLRSLTSESDPLSVSYPNSRKCDWLCSRKNHCSGFLLNAFLFVARDFSTSFWSKEIRTRALIISRSLVWPHFCLWHLLSGCESLKLSTSLCFRAWDVGFFTFENAWVSDTGPTCHCISPPCVPLLLDMPRRDVQRARVWDRGQSTVCCGGPAILLPAAKPAQVCGSTVCWALLNCTTHAGRALHISDPHGGTKISDYAVCLLADLFFQVLKPCPLNERQLHNISKNRLFL